MSAPIPGRMWLNSRTRGFASGQALVVEPTDPGETFVALWVAVDNEGPAVHLTVWQCREVAAALMARADLIDRGPVEVEIVDGEPMGVVG